MATIPSSLARVPNLLVSRISLSNNTRNSVDSLLQQEKLSSGKEINRPSDDSVRASVVLTLQQRLNQTDQRLRNYKHADALLSTIDTSLNDAVDLARNASQIASAQLGAGSDAGTRKNQAVVVGSLVNELASIANRDFTGIHLFGGDSVDQPPFEAFLGGYRYNGRGQGLRTDLGEGLDAPATIAGEEAFGALSARVKGDVDLNPALTLTTRLDDVAGARNVGIKPGPVTVAIFNGATTQNITVDLTGAQTIGETLTRLESAVRQAAPAAFTAGYPSSGVSGERLAFGGLQTAPPYTLRFLDTGTGSTAADLGIAGFTYTGANAVNTAANQDLDPRLTDFTTLGSLNATPPVTYGNIVFKNGAAQGVVTTSAGMTLGQFKSAVAALNLGIRAEISADGKSIDVVNEVSGLRMAIEEGGGTAATTLGIRTLKPSTKIADFNDGKGVQIADGAVDPVTGLPDPVRNNDFRITLKSGASVDVDLRKQDMGDVASVIGRIQNVADAAFGVGTLVVGLSNGSNGIVFTDSSVGGGTTAVTSLYGHAAEDLGLLGAKFTAGSPATLAGEDRATVRVDSAFSSLIELRGALETNDSRGITVAGERLNGDVDVLTRARATVGARAQRVDSARTREEDLSLVTQQIKSGLEDLDYTQATQKFTLLQLAQQAGLASTSRVTSLSLLDFLR